MSKETPNTNPLDKAEATHKELQHANAEVLRLREQFGVEVADVANNPNTSLRALRDRTGLSTVSLTKWVKKGGGRKEQPKPKAPAKKTAAKKAPAKRPAKKAPAKRASKRPAKAAATKS